MAAQLTRLSEHLSVFHGPINVGILHEGTRTMLIDCGDGRVMDACGGSIDAVTFTHHHRDQACGAAHLVKAGATLTVPEAERQWFDDVRAYWDGRASRWGLTCFHPHHLMLAESVPVHATVAGGDAFAWGPATVSVLDTPGHTDGSVTYVVDVDGRRVAFVGDALYDHGQVWNIHSLQKGTVTQDYHGFLGARPELTASLGRIESAGAELLVPSHGNIMKNPSAAIGAAVERLDACYDKYVAIAALRHYFPHMFTDYVGRPGHMPIRKGKPAPAFLRHVDTSWIIVSDDGPAFVLDCAGPNTVKKIEKLVGTVEGIWITHYHSDHTNGIPALKKRFGCPVFTAECMADNVANPLAWRQTCNTPTVMPVDKAARHGESWAWREFKFTAYNFPGQTLYHGGLLVEGRGVRMFFAGDSFTMAGIDDYCTHNRNWLGKGVGFDRCLALMAELKPTHIFNEHVEPAFDFTDAEIAFMRRNLAERETVYGALLPWEHANTGMDELWVRAYPYEQKVRAGGTARFQVIVTNHAPKPQRVRARVQGAWVEAEAAAKSDVALEMALSVPADAAGRRVFPIDVVCGRWELPQFTETILAIER